MPTRNMNQIDRILRALVACGCFWLAFADHDFFASTVIRVLLGCFGTINAFSAIIAHCPVYKLAGVSTGRPNDE